MQRFMGKFAGLIWQLYGLRKPMVAGIGGHAIAGGCILALTPTTASWPAAACRSA
jgi:enoyl-CoA hydratase/carnithine racemase